MPLTNDEYIHLAEEGLDILLDHYGYKGSKILELFSDVKISVSSSSFYNYKNHFYQGIVEGKKQPGPDTIQLLAEGFGKILNTYGWQYDQDLADYQQIDKRSPKEIKNLLENKTDHTLKPYEGGRRTADEKIELYQSAKYEIIELGIRLNTFSKRFILESDATFRQPIIEVLRRGVDFKCYILDPDRQMARMYFDDRAQVQPSEAEALRDIPKIIEDLKKIFQSLNAESDRGKMYLYTYNHFPYIHVSAIDPPGAKERVIKGSVSSKEDNNLGCMFISQYLYGIKRSNSPGMELYYKYHRRMFETYWNSVQATIKDAKLLIP